MDALTKLISLVNESQVVCQETPHAHLELARESIRYLESDKARYSLNQDTYWPKWDSPWWHISLLHEMGLSKQIPHKAMIALLESAMAQ